MSDPAAAGWPPRASDVGVVVPVYGWAPFLAEALDALLGQDPPPGEVVVVDDGSPEPVELCAEHAARCRLLRIEHGGLGPARAAGVHALGTPLIALCDADDAWEPGALDTTLRSWALHPEADLCFGRALIVGPDGRPTGERWDSLAAGRHGGEAFLRSLFDHNPIPVSSVVIRRSALDAAGGLDNDQGATADLDLWLALASRGTVFLCEPRAVVRYRRHPEAMTGDVAGLARAQLAVHRRHASEVDAAAWRAVEARDLLGLAGGLTRERRYRQARRMLMASSRLEPLPRRERARLALLRVPVLRGRLGRRDPYRR